MGGGLLDWNSEGMGGTQFGILNAWGISALKFQKGKTAKALPEIAELIIFLVWKGLRKQDKVCAG